MKRPAVLAQLCRTLPGDVIGTMAFVLGEFEEDAVRTVNATIIERLDR